MTTSSAPSEASRDPWVSFVRDSAAAQRRWATDYACGHRLRRRIGWALAVAISGLHSVTTYQSITGVLDYYEPRAASALVAVCWVFFAVCGPIIFALQIRVRSFEGEQSFGWWMVIWLTSLFNGIIGGVHFFPAGQVELGLVHTVSAVAVPTILILSVAIPPDPSVDWGLVMLGYLTSVTARTTHTEHEPTVHSWRDAEHMTAAWLRRFGYRDAQVTAQGADDGKDVEAYGAVAQVKRWTSRRTTAPEVRKLAGAAKPGQARFFFATGGYTEPAIVWASRSEHRVALFQLEADGNLSAVNSYAKHALWGTAFQLPAARRKPMTVRQKLWWSAFQVPCLFGLPIFISVALLTSARQPHTTVVLGFFWVLSVIYITDIFRSDLPRLATAVREYARTRHWPGWRTLILPDKVDDRDSGLPPDLFVGYEIPWFVHFFRQLDRVRFIAASVVRVLASRVPRSHRAYGNRGLRG